MNIPNSRQDILIEECFESLIDIPNDGRFLFTDPHPYKILGAPYGEKESPFQLREGVLISLIQATENLSKRYPGYKFRIFDAYRPLAVQEFMVKHTAQEFCRRIYGILLQEAVMEVRQESMSHALSIFAEPNTSLEAPPPHSTGSAIDLTIVNAEGIDLSMGSEIDELKNAHSNTFADSMEPQEMIFYYNRLLLKEIMEEVGFIQLSGEWWHFSKDDQNAVFLKAKKSGEYSSLIAKYGRVTK